MTFRFVLRALTFVLALTTSAAAQQGVPTERFIYSRDTDFPGADISNLFDTTLEACERACRADRTCAAFTFNARSNACFPKRQVLGSAPYTGAMSAMRVGADPATLARAAQRMPALDFLTQSDLQAAANLAEVNARRFPAGGQVAADMGRALATTMAQGSYTQARLWAGYLASLTDQADAWSAFSYASLRLGDDVSNRDRRIARGEAISAAINGVLRARSDGEEAEILIRLAEAFEANGRGRDMIPALRRAWELTDRDDIADKLDVAISKYGFRLIDHQVDSDSARPRVCATFSEPLVARGVDYNTFVSVPTAELVTTVEDQQLCLEGVTHGERYNVTFRTGLPAASGERLARNRRLDLYVRDRTPSVRFAGRAYVLPRMDGAALPVQSVNTSRVDLTLSRVSDRNLMRSIQDQYFGRPLSRWEEEDFAETIGAEIWKGTADLQNELNREMTTRLPLGEMLAGQDPGIYVLKASVAGSTSDDTATQWFVLSDLGLTSMKGTDGLSVAVRSLIDAGAKAGVEVSLISAANEVLGTATSDASGFARFEAGLVRGTGSMAPALLVAQTDEDLAFLPLTGPAFDLSDRGVEGRPAPGPMDVFVHTDRGAYRAGETIGVTALLRDDAIEALPDLPLTAVLQRPDGAEYLRATADQQAASGHVFRLPLGADVARGVWRLDLRLDEDGPPLASQTVLVEDFLPERLDIALNLSGDRIRLGDRPPLQVQADYLFGAPAADLPVEGEVQLRPTRSLADWPGYLFGPHDNSARTRVAFLDPARTSETGAATLGVQFPDIDAVSIPLEAEMIVRVSEGSGRPVERSLKRAVMPETALVGIKPGFEDIVAEGSEASFDLVALSQDGAPLTGTATWTLNRVETRYQWYQLYGDWNWEPTTRRSRVAAGNITLDGAAASLSVSVEWGEYELVVDLDGAPNAYGSVLFSAGWYGSGDTTQTPDRLQVGLDRDSYDIGNTAQLRFNAPAGGTALISVLSSAVIHREVVSLDPGSSVVPLQVTEDWGTGAYVTASVLRPVGDDNPAPARALGLAHASVSPGGKALTVSLGAPELVDGQPGAVEVVVRAEGLADEQGFVTLAAVDLGIQNLTAHAAPDPQAHYFGQRRLGVALRDLYGRLIDGQSGPLGQVRSGGDAGAAANLQAPPPTEESMFFFSGLVPFGPDGTARIRFTKPAFNGTIRLDAIAWTEDAIGQATQEVIARDPVVMTASLPRFMAPGDQSRLLLEFVHAEGAEGPMPLSVMAAGVQTGAFPSTVEIRPGQRAVVEVPVSAFRVGDHEITAALQLPTGQTISKRLTLGVRQNDPEVSTSRRFSLAPGETFRFDGEVFAGLKSGTGGATLTAGPLARFDMPGLIAQLDRYPYGCTEQLTSTSMPLLYLSEFAPGTDAKPKIEQAIARILTRQTGAGSFGLWRAESGELWLDAYVTDFLTRARDQGMDVPEQALSLALDNLRNRLNYVPEFDEGGEGVAYALLVLAQEGRASVADLRYYADVKSDAFSTPFATAQMGAALASYGDTERADVMFAQAARMVAGQNLDQRSWRVDFGSPVSDAAGVLRLASVAGSSVVDRTLLAAWLDPSRRLSTQEAAQVLLAANALRGAPGSAGLDVNGAPSAGPVIQRLENTNDGTVYNIRNTGAQPTDVTLTTFGVPEVPAAASGYGYALSRAYFTPDGAPVTSPVRAGEQLVVVLTITPFEETGARLMLEDPLPAGLEIDNPNLIFTGQIRGLDWLRTDPTEHAEFLSDRFRAALETRGADPVRVAYKVRAVSPGSFHHPAAMVHDMYRPEYRAVTDTGRWQVLP